MLAGKLWLHGAVPTVRARSRCGTSVHLASVPLVSPPGGWLARVCEAPVHRQCGGSSEDSVPAATQVCETWLLVPSSLHLVRKRDCAPAVSPALWLGWRHEANRWAGKGLSRANLSSEVCTEAQGHSEHRMPLGAAREAECAALAAQSESCASRLLTARPPAPGDLLPKSPPNEEGPLLPLWLRRVFVPYRTGYEGDSSVWGCLSGRPGSAFDD